MLEESCAGDVRGTSCGGPKLPTVVVFNGCACFGAVFSIGATFMGLAVNQSFRTNGDKRMTIIVVLFIDVRICQ